MKYWNLEPYMGFGAAAHSDFDGCRYSIYKGYQRLYTRGLRGRVNNDEMGEIKLM
jgi:coproporphyrinogen III oxidase-like Fe-S oxidoreductase